MKTLVIHPKDSTTDFLAEIYYDDWTIISNYIPTFKLKKEIANYDRIIMMGHGNPHGLFMKNRGYFIDSSFVEILRTKEVICIWCHANQFVEREKLNSSLYTGMIISEVREANCYLGSNPLDEEVALSNKLFASAIRKSFKVDKNKVVSTILENYSIEENDSVNFKEIMEYNRKRIYSGIN